jgi:hypothetical protein
MSAPTFQKATRKKAKLKLAISGPSGSGKTFSALRLACGLGKRVAFIDSENGSASLYSDRFAFDVLDIAPPYTHDKFISAIHCAADAGYDVVVIDSASHFWEGILEFKAKLDTRAGSNSYTNWNEAGAKFKGILDAVLQSPLHVICCLRSKMDYIMETNERGKQAPKKVGLAPIMRDGIEYEFTTVFDVDMSHQAKTSKDRTGLFKDEIFQISEGTGTSLLAWMDSGAEPTPVPAKVDSKGNPATKKTTWLPEQTTRLGLLRADVLAEFGDAGDKQLIDLGRKMAYDPAEDTLDAIATLLNELRETKNQGNNQ